ncbi:hypothetical protein B0H17DRAFT_1190716 [Mycena rosella]|uniref:Uncharacterized protein n=1 Tax=Mycena rosella TaxID=1033263 RepID=A0AAD7H0I0_MYCRO|nr:hypothetical protein B0H17DRAFT_1190716 [Mycena rosella]
MAYHQPAYLPVQYQQPQEQAPSHSNSQNSQYLAVQQRPPEQAQRRDASVDTCIFAPGLHRLSAPPPTPAALLSGAYAPARAIECFPRRAAFCGRPSLSIAFAVHTQPAPYLAELLRGRVRLDGAHDAVMRAHGWSRTRWVLEWPGYERAPRGLLVAGLTRAGLAKEIAEAVPLFLREAPAPLGEDGPWAARNVHFGDLRLVALNYYGRVWVPVLAFDAL